LAVQSATASTTSSTGAAVVTGGLGVGGAINAAGAVNAGASSSISTTGLVYKTITSTTTATTNEAGLMLQRGAQSNGYAQSHYGTATTDLWATGLRAGDNNFHIFDVAAPRDAITVSPGASGTVTLTQTTASSGTGSGALVVSGGVGVAGATFTNTLSVTSSTASNSASSGAAVITGGLGVGGALFTSGTVNFATLSISSLVATDGSKNLLSTTSTLSPTFTGLTLSGTLAVQSSTASTTTSNGAAVITGGLGVGGAINAGLSSSISGTGSLYMTISSSSSSSEVGLTLTRADQATSYATIHFQNPSTDLWDLGVRAGDNNLRIRDSVNSRDSITITPGAVSASTTTITATTTSSSTTTGALVVSGGVGVAGAVYTGGLINTASTLTVQSSTASTTTSTGAAVVTGGLGVGGNLNVGGSSNTIGTAVPTSNAALLNLIGTDSSGSAGPHLQAYTSTDLNYPTYELFSYTHNNMAVVFDAFYSTSVANWVSSHSGSNFWIYKSGNQLMFKYTSGYTAGSTITTQPTAGYVDTSGILNWNNQVKALASTAAVSTSTGALVVTGGVGVGGALYVSGTTNIASLSANTLVATDSSSSLTTAVTGMSPTLTGLTLSGLSATAIVTTTAGSALSSVAAASSYSPTLGDGTNTFTMTTQTGSYYKIGHVYLVNVDIVWTGKGSASSGSSTRASLPAAIGASNTRVSCAIGYANGISFTGSYLVASGTNGNSYITFNGFSNTGTPTGVTVSQFGTAGELQFSCTYWDN